jgi:hypothetical protein
VSDSGTKTDSREGVEKRHVFPPALVPILRKRLNDAHPALLGIDDATLAELLTIVFFAGLETEEGEHHPVKIVFVGKNPQEWIPPRDAPGEGGPIYRWSTMRFHEPRPVTVPELVKLTVVTDSDRVYTKVRYDDDGRFTIVGLAREGFNYEGDPFLKIEVTKPGTLSVRTGHDRVLDYERGHVISGGEDIVLTAGPVRRALERFAQDEGLHGEAIPDYLDMVRAVVREMAAHGHGGIIIVGTAKNLTIEELAGYRTEPDVSLATLVRHLHGYGPRKRTSTLRPPVSLGEVLRGAFLSEAERTIEELGALTATDGATVLDSSLALLGFGIVLPIAQPWSVREALDVEGTIQRPFDLGTRGTRHRAAATYARTAPGSVVFVSSQDGEMGCLYRDPAWDNAVLWRFGPRE